MNRIVCNWKLCSIESEKVHPLWMETGHDQGLKLWPIALTLSECVSPAFVLEQKCPVTVSNPSSGLRGTYIHSTALPKL